MRDERFYTESAHPDFLRRAPWLYPIDGCFARAGHMAQSMERQGLPRPGKIFAFGRLRVKTPYAPVGWAYWSYHVATAYNFRGVTLVMDPAVDLLRILTLEQWMGLIAKNPSTIRLKVCDTYAYSPSQKCVGGGPQQERSTGYHLKGYLSAEWDNVAALRLRPEAVLGDQPPWLMAPVQDQLPPVPSEQPSQTSICE
jgi:hypothetical protein